MLQLLKKCYNYY